MQEMSQPIKLEIITTMISPELALHTVSMANIFQ
jgi:hypothetical protein